MYVASGRQGYGRICRRPNASKMTRLIAHEESIGSAHVFRL